MLLVRELEFFVIFVEVVINLRRFQCMSDSARFLFIKTTV